MFFCEFCEFLRTPFFTEQLWAADSESAPLVVQAIPKVTFNEQWLAEKICDNIVNLIEIGLCEQGIIATDNDSANINTFSALIKITR